MKWSSRFQRLVSRNDDIRRLVEKGYAVAFDDGYLVVRDIPYLDASGALQTGSFVTKLVFEDEDLVSQVDHQVFFAGSAPYGLDGKPIPNLGGGETQLQLSEASGDVRVQRSFSNKPQLAGKFADFFEKIESYVAIVSGPAIERHGADPFTFRVVGEVAGNPVFKFHDTLTSRAEIGDLSARLGGEVVAVIGLGGTGGYLLDFLVKSAVKEVRGFDADTFQVHTAYRSPGGLDPDEFRKPKAEVYQARYENFRHGLSLEAKYIDASGAAELDGVTFAFVCVDKGSSRAAVFEALIAREIPFIDAGMGLHRQGGAINGTLRATYYSAEGAQALRDRGLAPLADDPDEIYRTNIQIGELNALNACLAVIRFKQLRGFYYEDAPYYHLLMELGAIKVFGEAAEDDIQA